MKEKGILILGNKKYKEDTIFDVDKRDSKYGDITLNYSHFQSSWTKPGQASTQLINTGNGFKFISYDINMNATEIDLDYSQAHELRALLKMFDDSGETFKYVKVTNSNGR